MRQCNNCFHRLAFCTLMLAGMFTPVFATAAQWPGMHFPESDPPSVVQSSAETPSSRMLAIAAASADSNSSKHPRWPCYLSAWPSRGCRQWSGDTAWASPTAMSVSFRGFSSSMPVDASGSATLHAIPPTTRIRTSCWISFSPAWRFRKALDDRQPFSFLPAVTRPLYNYSDHWVYGV